MTARQTTAGELAPMLPLPTRRQQHTGPDRDAGRQPTADENLR